ncbi:unnamed protein product, partial [Symbiodinium pilosum]
MLLGVYVESQVENHLIPNNDRLREVGAVRKDELIKGKSEELFLVVLQGRASVQLDGSVLRELSEGESFGEAACAGLVQSTRGDLALEIYA